MIASAEELKKSPEVGEKVAASIKQWFEIESNINIINELKAKGLKLEVDESNLRLGNALEGMSFVVSGLFSKFNRDELKDTIEKYGGRVVSAVSSKTNYLVAGEESGPSKLEKADKLGVNVISEKQFLELING